MTRALDPGSCRLRSLYREGAKLLAHSERAVYSVLPDTPEHRCLLEKAGLKIATCDDGIVLCGNTAYDSARLFHTTCHRLLPSGQLPENDPLARQLLASLIERLLPKATEPGEICSTTIPGGGDTDNGHGRANLDFLERVIRLQGYEPHIVPASQALILAQLSANAFTGIGLIFGASGCEAMLAHRGVPVCHVRTDRGGHWLDQELATVCEQTVFSNEGNELLDVDGVERRRESLRASLTISGEAFEQSCVRLLTQLTSRLLTELAAELRRSPRAAAIPQPVPIVCSDGLASSPGFTAILNEALSECPLPIECEPPRLDTDSDYTIARGLLIAAELEAASPARRSAA